MDYRNSVNYLSIIKYIQKEFPNRLAILEELLEPTISIVSSAEQKISKFGGEPDFPLNFDKYELSDDLKFLCQLSIKDIEKINFNSEILDDGILYFFVNPNFNYPPTRDDIKVIYIDDPNLDELDFTINSKDSVYMGFRLHFNFPSYQSQQIISFSNKGAPLDYITEELQDIIDEKTYHESENVGSQVFGNPQAVQGAVKFHWSLRDLGLKYPLSDSQIDKVRDKESDFVLLLQLDFSDFKIDGFGDGVAYFGLKKEDLLKKNFNNVFFEYQST